MPLYEYYCETCKREVTMPMSMSEHEQGHPVCPTCGGKALRPLVGSFYPRTSRKS